MPASNVANIRMEIPPQPKLHICANKFNFISTHLCTDATIKASLKITGGVPYVKELNLSKMVFVSVSVISLWIFKRFPTMTRNTKQIVLDRKW